MRNVGKSKRLEITTDRRPGIVHHSDFIVDTDCSMDEMSHVSDLSGSKDGKKNNEKSKTVCLFPPKKNVMSLYIFFKHFFMCR